MFRVFSSAPELVAARGEKWISEAIKHPGALRKSAKAKSGKKIPVTKLKKLQHSKDPTTRRRAVLAQTLRKFGKKKRSK